VPRSELLIGHGSAALRRRAPSPRVGGRAPVAARAVRILCRGRRAGVASGAARNLAEALGTIRTRTRASSARDRAGHRVTGVFF
jgi:hypothetical protein